MLGRVTVAEAAPHRPWAPLPPNLQPCLEIMRAPWSSGSSPRAQDPASLLSIPEGIHQPSSQPSPSTCWRPLQAESHPCCCPFCCSQSHSICTGVLLLHLQPTCGENVPSLSQCSVLLGSPSSPWAVLAPTSPLLPPPLHQEPCQPPCGAAPSPQEGLWVQPLSPLKITMTTRPLSLLLPGCVAMVLQEVVTWTPGLKGRKHFQFPASPSHLFIRKFINLRGQFILRISAILLMHKEKIHQRLSAVPGNRP